MKICTRCKVGKEFTEFNKKTKSKDGYDCKCRQCAVNEMKEYRKNPSVIYRQNKYSKQYNRIHAAQVKKSQLLWIKNNPDAIKDYHLKKNYGVSLEQYRAMMMEQNECCAICDVPQTAFKKAFHVDHCHKTKKIRGLLCFRCNLVLGHIDDAPIKFQRMLDYLKKYQ